MRRRGAAGASEVAGDNADRVVKAFSHEARYRCSEVESRPSGGLDAGDGDAMKSEWAGGRAGGRTPP
jgi:hypothetical protein